MSRLGYVCDGCGAECAGQDPSAVVQDDDSDWIDLCETCYESRLNEGEEDLPALGGSPTDEINWDHSPESRHLSERATAAWCPNGDRAVYVVETEGAEGWKMEVYLTPEEMDELVRYHQEAQNDEETDEG